MLRYLLGFCSRPPPRGYLKQSILGILYNGGGGLSVEKNQAYGYEEIDSVEYEGSAVM